MEDKIIVEGTKSHNLKDVDIDSAQKIGLVERNLNKVSFSNRMSFIVNIMLHYSTPQTLRLIERFVVKPKLVHWRVTI
jgi:excinuclease UvrABC ATPase subunit